GSDHDVDAGLHVRVAALADAVDATVLQADVGLHDAVVIDDQRVGDDGVHRLRPGSLTLAHTVADHLAPAELHLLAVARAVLFDLDHEPRVGEAHAVADGRSVHRGVRASIHA